jgi:hypothetical protein
LRFPLEGDGAKDEVMDKSDWPVAEDIEWVAIAFEEKLTAARPRIPPTAIRQLYRRQCGAI